MRCPRGRQVGEVAIVALRRPAVCHHAHSRSKAAPLALSTSSSKLPPILNPEARNTLLQHAEAAQEADYTMLRF